MTLPALLQYMYLVNRVLAVSLPESSASIQSTSDPHRSQLKSPARLCSAAGLRYKSTATIGFAAFLEVAVNWHTQLALELVHLYNLVANVVDKAK